jgi:lipase chaperone LimK
MSKLYHLAYISKNAFVGTLEEQEKNLRSILGFAQRNNALLGVTGALLYSGGYYCQIIEGDRDVLENLFETIQMDRRHNEITVLHFEPIELRSFSEWAMALAGNEDAMRFDVEGIRASKDEILMRDAGRDMVIVLEQMVKQHQAILKTPG